MEKRKPNNRYVDEMEKRKPENRYAVRAQAVPEISQHLDQEAARLIGQLRFRGGKVKPGPLQVAFLIYCLRLPPEQRLEIARENLAIYEELLTLDRPVASLEHFGRRSLGNGS